MLIEEQLIARKFKKISPYLNERMLRIWIATESLNLSRGGISKLSKVTGVSRPTIYAGLKELHQKKTKKFTQEIHRARQLGGGRKCITEKDKTILVDLENIIDSSTRGDPMSPLLWSSKSTLKITMELKKMGHQISQPTVYKFLDFLGYSMQSNRKTKEGSNHPDRNEQFHYISKKVLDFQSRNQPVISVDAKKKEAIGEFKNNGQEWRKKGEPIETNMHDFPDKQLGKVTPYGVYDIAKNKGWVSVGISSNTAEFAVASIRNWWNEMGKQVYQNASELLITADGGGSNGNHVGLWKKELRKLADELNLEINVCHFPPGTSKWNKIEHRMFCHITENWRGRPLISRAVVVSLIGHTTTRNGLKIKAKLDTHEYKKGIKVTKKELKTLEIIGDSFHGEWNYKIRPQMH
jgi:hypothetical protein